MKNITQSLKVIALALVLSFGLSYVYAWTAPTANPPAGNVSAPINTSATSQLKGGAFGVNGLFKGYLEVDTPRICLSAGADGTNCITAWPAVGGSGTVTSLSQGTGITLSPNPITTTGTITNSGVTSLVAGTNVTLSPASGVGAVTVNASGGGTGLSAVLAPLKGKTISCNYGGAIFGSAMVDSSGNPFVKYNTGAWNAGFYKGGFIYGCFHNIDVQMDSVGVVVKGQDTGGCGGGPLFVMCTATWPLI